jgi:hypothetical protein
VICCVCLCGLEMVEVIRVMIREVVMVVEMVEVVKVMGMVMVMVVVMVF